MLSPVGVSIEERLSTIPRRFSKVIHHVIRCGTALVLAAASLQSREDLRDMASVFPLMDEPGDASALAVEFRDTAGAIAKSKRVEDVIRSTPHEV
jgi:hypothetical protein